MQLITVYSPPGSILTVVMTEEQEKIIVLKSFENPIQGSLAKSKLDAYGIPCFVTEENFGNLYPLQNPRFSGVRLHVFEKDQEQARQVLNENLILAEQEQSRCPRCHSVNITRASDRPFKYRLVALVFYVITAIIPPKKAYHCRNCQHNF